MIFIGDMMEEMIQASVTLFIHFQSFLQNFDTLTYLLTPIFHNKLIEKNYELLNVLNMET